MVSSYEKAVRENLAQMGSHPSEWRALPFVLMEDEESGKIVPQVDWSAAKGYARAPTLFPNQGSGDMCCELCAHKIKNVYGIINEKRRWVLQVGSECVTHFEGASGEEMAREALEATALLALEKLRRLGKVIRGNMSDRYAPMYYWWRKIEPILSAGNKTKQSLAVWFNRYKDKMQSVYDAVAKVGYKALQDPYMSQADKTAWQEFINP